MANRSVFDVTLEYNHLISSALRDCPAPGEPDTVTAILGIQLSCIILFLDADKTNVSDIVASYIDRLAGICSPEACSRYQQRIFEYTSKSTEALVDAISSESGQNPLYLLGKLVYEYTQTPYDLQDAVEVASAIAEYTENMSLLVTRTYRPPSEPPRKKKRTGLIWAGIVAVLLLSAVIANVANESGSSAPAPSPEFHAPIISAYNGEQFQQPSYDCTCPLSVSVKGEDGYYVYLQYQYQPGSSTTTRQYVGGGSGNGNDISFFVKPNQTAEVDVPIGVYKLYYASGETWYGEKLKFGPDTIYSSSEELLEFYSDDQYYNGVDLELWKQSGGNFSTHTVDESSFPSP